MRAVVTGQVGMDKKAYLEEVAALGKERGEPIDLYHVGDMMYDEAADVRKGHILDVQLSRLNALRRSAFKDIIQDSLTEPRKNNLLVNTHATFRWRHGLFSAFDFDQMRALKPDLIICLLDNIEVVHARLHRDHTVDATLKDLMVWREEEIMASELVAQALGLGNRFYVLSRGRNHVTSETCRRLLTEPKMRTVYPSFPMSHVTHLPEVRAEIDAFRAKLAEHFIAFDPGDVDEKLLLDQAIGAAKSGKDFIETQAGREAAMISPGQDEAGGKVTLRVPVKQVLDIAGDIDGQIYARDFKMVRQADMIVSLVPEIPTPPTPQPPDGEHPGDQRSLGPWATAPSEDTGMPGLSSGVERELHHAFEHGKEVYVVWKPKRSPSPFITETATRVFDCVDDALDYFDAHNMFAPKNLFGQ